VQGVRTNHDIDVLVKMVSVRPLPSCVTAGFRLTVH
jgi:hypothetical protein